MTPPTAPGAEARVALLAGIGCYLIWGFVPLVFQAIGALGVGPWEILAHRTVWGTPTALIFVLLAGQWRQVVRVFAKPQVLAWLALSAALIATNWCVFIWAVTSGRVLETSLGYYINPLLAMAAGALLFRERIDRLGMVGHRARAVGVAVQAVAIGGLPLVSLALAFSFGGYGIVRKQVAASPRPAC
jgi:chloramphenicol-sensitive protein RarD